MIFICGIPSTIYWAIYRWRRGIRPQGTIMLDIAVQVLLWLVAGFGIVLFLYLISHHRGTL